MEQVPHTPKNIVLSLQDRAKESKVFNAMAHAFAMRERTRQQVTVHNLKYSLAKEGFNFERDQYRKELKFLAGLGIGKISTDRKGRPTAIKNIHYTLQSIGMAALNKMETIEKFTPGPVFKKLPEPTFNDFRKPLEGAKPDRPVPSAVPFEARLVVTVEGKTMELNLIPGLTTKDILVLVSKVIAAKKEA